MTVHGPGKSDRPSALALHSERIVATRCQGTYLPPSSGKAPLCQARRASSLALTGPGPESAANGFRGREGGGAGSSLALTGPGPESAANGFRERERMEAPDASPHVSL